jgi:hypothetical protein
VTRLIDLSGKRFGRLKVVSKADSVKGQTLWICKCDCGVSKTLYAQHLMRRRTISCGCARRIERNDKFPSPIEGAKWIPLGHGKFTLVDDDDYEKFSRHTWCITSEGYASRTSLHKVIYLHREVIKAKAKSVVDHLNRNRLDNRKENLRVCSQGQNIQRRGKFKKASTSKYKGVHWNESRKRWIAQIVIQNKNIRLGRFKDEIEAAKAYDRRALETFGKYAWTNF